MKIKVILLRIFENVLLAGALLVVIPTVPSDISEKLSFSFLSVILFIANRILVLKRKADNLIIIIIQVIVYALFAYGIYERVLMGN
ncbi:hypothetical protein HZA73_03095 [candidate division TA06 bacterium]|nr:hypothetical protein [candidate division TA06 bacterium]